MRSLEGKEDKILFTNYPFFENILLKKNDILLKKKNKPSKKSSVDFWKLPIFKTPSQFVCYDLDFIWEYFIV